MPKVRLTVAYHQPPDADAFYQRYAEGHVPLVKELPGLESFEWSKVVATPTGEEPRYALLANLTFASMESFGGAMGGPEGAAASADATALAANGMDMFISEIADS